MSTPPGPDAPAGRRRAALALALLVPAPTIGSYAALVAAPGPLGQAVYALSKAWLLIFPLAWYVVVERRPLTLARPTRRGLLAGLAQGLVVVAVVGAAWLTFGRGLVDPGPLRAALATAGLTSATRYAALVAYLAIVNSLLEEYVWRWFVTTRWSTLVPPRTAAMLSAACFTLHHVVALRAQLAWGPTALASAGVFTGGLLWSWLYVRYRSIWPGWVSHVLVDLAVLGIGAELLFGTR